MAESFFTRDTTLFSSMATTFISLSDEDLEYSFQGDEYGNDFIHHPIDLPSLELILSGYDSEETTNLDTHDKFSDIAESVNIDFLDIIYSDNDKYNDVKSPEVEQKGVIKQERMEYSAMDLISDLFETVENGNEQQCSNSYGILSNLSDNPFAIPCCNEDTTTIAQQEAHAYPGEETHEPFSVDIKKLYESIENNAENPINSASQTDIIRSAYTLAMQCTSPGVPENTNEDKSANNQSGYLPTDTIDSSFLDSLCSTPNNSDCSTPRSEQLISERSFLSSPDSGYSDNDSTSDSSFSSPLASQKSNNAQLKSEPQDSKPKASYVELIARAIMNSQNGKAALNHIYDYILDNYPYFRTANPSWRISVRHNLCTNICFVKQGRVPCSRGFWWAIHSLCQEEFSKGNFDWATLRKRIQLQCREAVKQSEENDVEIIKCDVMNGAQGDNFRCESTPKSTSSRPRSSKRKLSAMTLESNHSDRTVYAESQDQSSATTCDSTTKHFGYYPQQSNEQYSPMAYHSSYGNYNGYYNNHGYHNKQTAYGYQGYGKMPQNMNSYNPGYYQNSGQYSQQSYGFGNQYSTTPYQYGQYSNDQYSKYHGYSYGNLGHASYGNY